MAMAADPLVDVGRNVSKNCGVLLVMLRDLAHVDLAHVGRDLAHSARDAVGLPCKLGMARQSDLLLVLARIAKC